MFVKVKQTELSEALDKIIVTTSKSAKSIPWVSAVRIVFKEDSLIFYGRSRNDSIMVKVPTEESNGGNCYFGVSCVDLKKLVDTFYLKDEPVLLVYDEVADTMAKPLCVKYGASMFNLWTLGPEHMSPIEDFGGVSYHDLDLGELMHGLRLVAYCMHPERDSMNGVHIDEKYLATTDGMRLSLYENTQLIEGLGGGSIMIPPESVVRMLSIFKGGKSEKEAYACDKTSLTIIKDRICYRTRLKVAKFPNYLSVLPKGPHTPCSVSRVETLASLERIVAMSSKTASSATLSLYPKQEEIRMFTKSDKGDVEDVIEMEYDGPEFSLKMNPKFLVEIIKRLRGDKVIYKFVFTESRKKLNQVVEISEGPYRNFLNPMRDD